MNIALWIVQILLAFVFLMAGVTKTFTSIPELALQMAWVAEVNPWLMVRLPGIAEVAGALGLILPSLTRIQPKLTPLAAAGLALVMLLAAIFHLVLGDFGGIPPNIVLLLLSAFVAYGRWKLVPIAPK